jgi:hypothetical protein
VKGQRIRQRDAVGQMTTLWGCWDCNGKPIGVGDHIRYFGGYKEMVRAVVLKTSEKRSPNGAVSGSLVARPYKIGPVYFQGYDVTIRRPRRVEVVRPDRRMKSA